MNPTNIAFLGFVILVLVPIGIFFLYFLQTTEKRFEKNTKSRFQSFDAIKRFNITVNHKTKNIDLVYRIDKLASNNLTYSEFKNQLDQENFELFETWIDEVLRRKDANKNITLYFKPSRTYRGFFARLTVVKIDKTKGLVFATGLRSARESTKVLKGVKILGAYAFKEKIEEIKPKQGVMIVFNFNLLDVITRRYDKEVGTMYIKALWTTVVNRLIDDSTIVGIYRGDSVALFNPKLNTKRDAIAFVEQQIKKFGSILTFENYTFDIKPITGFTLFNEYTANLELLIKQAFKAAEYARINNLAFSDYDNELEKQDSSNLKQSNEIKRMVEQQLVNPVFVPITSLINGKVFGVIAKLNFAFTSIKNFNAAFQIAKENDLEKEFVELTISQWFNQFLKQNDKYRKLMILIDTKQLEVVERILVGQPRFKKLPLLLVITDYDIIVKNKTNLSEIEVLKKIGVTFGVVAHPSMQTIIHPILKDFEFIVWPSRLTRDVLKDEKAQLIIENIIEATEPFSMRSIAWEIKTFEQGEYLKNKGVLLMAGPLFNSDNDGSNSGYSARKVQKLIG